MADRDRHDQQQQDRLLRQERDRQDRQDHQDQQRNHRRQDRQEQEAVRHDQDRNRPGHGQGRDYKVVSTANDLHLSSPAFTSSSERSIDQQAKSD
jgi:hypothetical protein